MELNKGTAAICILSLLVSSVSCTRTYQVRPIDLEAAKEVVKNSDPDAITMPAKSTSGTDTYLRMSSIDMATIKLKPEDEWATVEVTDYSTPLTYTGISLTALGLAVGIASIALAAGGSDGYGDPSAAIGILGGLVGGGLTLIGLPMMINGLVRDSHEADAPSPAKWPSTTSARYGLSLTIGLP